MGSKGSWSESLAKSPHESRRVGHGTVGTGTAEGDLGTEGRAGLCLQLPRHSARLQTHHSQLVCRH